MILPRNITQIGEINSSCKVYVEDYVVSYVKQLNQLAMDKPMAAAVYGIRKEENGVEYLFVYGGAQLDYLFRECRHLSQAQLQEIERFRRKYFQEYAFLGYCLLSGEMLEGFYIYEQGICRYTQGYARFYEKNDSMLAFMLDNRLAEPTPELVDETKYALVRSRQEERKRKGEEETRRTVPGEKRQEAEESNFSFQYRFAKTAMAAVFCLVCVLALALLTRKPGSDNGLFQASTWKELGQIFSGTEENSEAVYPVAGDGVVDKLVIEDNLNRAILEENQERSEEVLQESTESLENTQASAEQEAPGLSSETSGTGTTGNLVPSSADATEQSVETVLPGTEQNTETGNGLVQPGESEQTVIIAPEQPTSSGEPEGAKTPSEPDVNEEPEDEPENAGVSNQGSVIEVIPEEITPVQPTSYTIIAGDTLIGISTRIYGSEQKVYEICRLNNIQNPDDIKVGAKILLP